MRQKALPNKLSELILLALEDLEKVELDSRYEVNMSPSWHSGSISKGTVCNVCFAGAVMSKSLGVKINTWTEPGEFGTKIKAKLHALDHIRVGAIQLALGSFYRVNYKYFGKFKDFNYELIEHVPNYIESPEDFKNSMIDIAVLLQCEGY